MKFWTCLWVFLFLNLGLIGQTNTLDSLFLEVESLDSDSNRVDFILDQIWYYRQRDVDISFDLLKKVKSIQEVMEPKYKLDVPLYYSGVLNKIKLNFKEAEESYMAYYEMNKLENNPRKMAAVKLALTNLYSDQDLWDKAIVTVKDALALYNTTKDTVNLIRTTRKISSILANINRFDDALEYNTRAYELATVYNDSLELGDVLNDIGIVYEKMEQFDSMFYYYTKYHDIAYALEDKSQQIYANYNLASAYAKIEEFDKSYYYASKSLGLCNETKDEYMARYSIAMMGSSNIKSGNTSSGIRQLHELIELGKLPLGLEKDVYESLYRGYKNNNNYNTALSYLEKFKTISDSLLNDNIANKVAQLEASFESERKENEIALLNSENELIESELSKAGRDRGYLIAGLIALLSIIGLLYRFIKSGKEHRKLLEEKNYQIQSALSDKETLLREIHHRVKNNLQVISSLLSLQSRQIDDPTAQLAIKEGRNRVKSMALIHQNLYQDEDLVGIHIPQYIDKLANSLVNSYQVQNLVTVSTDIEEVRMDIDQIIPLGLILNELISNALKYAFKEESHGQIEIKLRTHPDHIEIEVEDNGVGLPEDFSVENLDSLGYKLVKAFTQKLKANFEISDQKKGTKITLTIPQKYAA